MARADFKINVAWLFLLVAIGSKSARADVDDGERFSTVFGPYAIRQIDAEIPGRDSGRFQLVKLASGFGPAVGPSFVVENLKAFAVDGKVIVGAAEKGYFILDTPQFDRQDGGASADTFDDAEHWKAALTAAGIPPSIRLNDPAKMTFQSLHFFHYRVMKKLFGLSDEDWGAIVCLATLAMIFVRGLLMRPNAPLFPLATLLAWLATVAMIVTGVLDSGGFMGFIAFPLYYWLVGKFGRFFRKFIWDALMKRRVRGPLSPV